TGVASNPAEQHRTKGCPHPRVCRPSHFVQPPPPKDKSLPGTSRHPFLRRKGDEMLKATDCPVPSDRPSRHAPGGPHCPEAGGIKGLLSVAWQAHGHPEPKWKNCRRCCRARRSATRSWPCRRCPM